MTALRMLGWALPELSASVVINSGCVHDEGAERSSLTCAWN